MIRRILPSGSPQNVPPGTRGTKAATRGSGLLSRSIHFHAERERPRKTDMLARKITLLTSAALIVGAAALMSESCSKATHAEAESKASAAPTVAVAKAKTEDMSRGLVLTAEFKPFQEIDVMAKVAGYVKNINVDVGSRVKQGDLLAVLEIPEMADDQARAQSVLESQPGGGRPRPR